MFRCINRTLVIPCIEVGYHGQSEVEHDHHFHCVSSSISEVPLLSPQFVVSVVEVIK